VMVNRMLRDRRPVIVSSGMSPLSETDKVVARVQQQAVPLAILQCTSAYPCPPERVGVNMIPVYRDRYGCGVGLSDHSGTIYPSLAAATLGADVIEVHVTMSRQMFGPDVVASVTTAELAQLVEGVRFIERMLDHPIDKNAAAADLAPMRELFTKSIVARRALQAGTILAEEHLALKKPGTGIPAERLPELVGCRLTRDLDADELLSETDLERSRTHR